MDVCAVGMWVGDHKKAYASTSITPAVAQLSAQPTQLPRALGTSHPNQTRRAERKPYVTEYLSID